MNWTIKIFLLGFVCSLLILGFGQALKLQAKREIPERSKDCIPDTEIGLRFLCEGYNDDVRDSPIKIERESFYLALIVTGVGIIPWGIKYFLPWSWYFFLQRIREFSKAISGK